MFYAECIEHMYCTMLYLWAGVQGKKGTKKCSDTNLIVILDKQAYCSYQTKERRNLFLLMPYIIEKIKFLENETS